MIMSLGGRYYAQRKSVDCQPTVVTVCVLVFIHARNGPYVPLRDIQAIRASHAKRRSRP